MFGKTPGPGKYQNIALDDFSDDSSDEGENGGRRNMNGGGGRSNGGSADPAPSRLMQEQLMRQQDEGLEMLSQSAERLGQMSMAIHDELGLQNKILDDMDKDLTEASDRLEFVTKKTKDFIEQHMGNTRNCVVIATLALVVIILIFLILYT